METKVACTYRHESERFAFRRSEMICVTFTINVSSKTEDMAVLDRLPEVREKLKAVRGEGGGEMVYHYVSVPGSWATKQQDHTAIRGERTVALWAEFGTVRSLLGMCVDTVSTHCGIVKPTGIEWPSKKEKRYLPEQISRSIEDTWKRYKKNGFISKKGILIKHFGRPYFPEKGNFLPSIPLYREINSRNLGHRPNKENKAPK
jgi:hypothetical protein